VYIVVVEDDRGGLVCEHALFEGELTIGRTPENDIVLPSGTVSRSHARLYLEGTTAVIADKGSANGVMVDDRLVRGPTPINESNQIRIGEYRLFIERATGKMNAPQGGINTAIVHPDQAHGKLVVTAGPQAGREHLLFEPITCVGRTDENDVTLADASVSRHHARLKQQDDGGYVLTDLKSSNGTLLNHRRVVSATKAWHGDRIGFGNVECVLVDPHGKAHPGRRARQWIIHVLAVVAAAALGALVALLLQG